MCGGAKFLENQTIIQQFTYLYGVFLPSKQRVNVLHHLIDMCAPLCRIIHLSKLKNYIELLEYQNEDTNKIVHTLKRKLQTMRTLKESCRVIVRDCLQNRIFVNTGRLKLPVHLQKYLQYCECL